MFQGDVSAGDAVTAEGVIRDSILIATLISLNEPTLSLPMGSEGGNLSCSMLPSFPLKWNDGSGPGDARKCQRNLVKGNPKFLTGGFDAGTRDIEAGR